MDELGVEGLRAVLDRVPSSVAAARLVDGEDGPHLVFAYVNAYLLRQVGAREADVLGRRVEDVLPALAASGHLATFLEVAQTRQAQTYLMDDFRGEHVQGAFEASVTPWGTDGVVVVTTDHTAYRVEQDRLAAVQKLVQVQEAAGTGSWEWDVPGDVITWSDAMYALHGATPGERPQALVYRGVPSEDRARLRASLARAAQGGGTFTVRYRLRCNGTTRHLEAWTSVELGEDGRPSVIRGTERDVTDEVELQQTLEEHAYTDALTEIPNRRAWEDATTPDALSRLEQPVAVAVLDLDHFKVLNDTRGHAAGDEMLKACAKVWSSQLRRGDVIARIGGEEFAVLLPGCGLAEAKFVVDDLRRSVPGRATASAGVAQLGPDGLAAALRRADVALYEAKGTGRDRTVAAAA